MQFCWSSNVEMFSSRSFLVFVVGLFCSFPVWGQKSQMYPAVQEITVSEEPTYGTLTQPEIQDAVVEQLPSPLVSRIFYEIGYELAGSDKISPSDVEQAIVFLTASMNLDSSAGYIRPLLIKLMCQATKRDYSEDVYYALEDYVDGSADLEVVRYAIRFLLEQLDSREEREVLLSAMLRNIGDKNIILRSELATLLGVLAAEKPDLETARFYLVQAYSDNKYNQLAFKKLTEIMPDQIGPTVYLEQLRLALRENPSDIDAALAFAQYAERLGLYGVAAGTYEYCAELFRYLYPSEPLPVRIYLPLAINYYSTAKNRHKCLQIASELRQKGQFDLFLESIAGKAAVKIGDAEEATRIFKAAEDKAQQLLEQGPQIGAELSSDRSSRLRADTKRFAWFYCFVLPDAQKALDWANKAYSTEPDSPAAAALLAYSLMMNQQIEWAKPLIDNYERNQIADLTLAQIQLKEGQKGAAVNSLKSAVAKDPSSLEAEQAKELLAQLGAEYVSPFDANAILMVLENSFGRTLVPVFAAPERAISAQLNIRGNEFSYGSPIEGTVVITNNSPEPLVISDDGLFRGNIRIDAVINGDLEKNAPKLVSRRICSTFLIEPGRSLLVPVRLITGEVRQTLLAHPQATLDMEFTLYLDPVTNEQGEVTNRLAYIKPTKVRIKRPGIGLTGKYLRNRFDSIATGQASQKLQTAQLFTGLLMEQQAMANRKPLYRYLYADWMPTMLKSALIHKSGLLRNSSDSEWAVKVYTMDVMLSLSLDQEMARAVAENLNSTKWPVRMMALYLLAKDTDNKFDEVLGWAVEHDSNKFVRDMAIALGGTGPRASESMELLTPDEDLLPIHSRQ